MRPSAGPQNEQLAEAAMFTIWAGVDIGKEYHHCVALDARGERRLSRRVDDEAEPRPT